MLPPPLYKPVAEPPISSAIPGRVGLQRRPSPTGTPKSSSKSRRCGKQTVYGCSNTAGPRNLVQIAFSTKPDIAPSTLAARAKGRLNHALRNAGNPVSFRRKFAVRSLGENTRQNVEGYIAQQVAKEHFADPRFHRRMQQFTVTNPSVNLSMPFEAKRGRYWYNLHLVLLVADRGRLSEDRELALIRDGAFHVADERGYLISRLSVMPDHLHLALRGEPNDSPETIALAYQNELASLVGCRLWRDGYYAGTFSEYDMGAVRAHAQ